MSTMEFALLVVFSACMLEAFLLFYGIASALI